MKVKDLLSLNKGSQRDRQLLLAHLLSKRPADVYLLMEEEVPQEIVQKYMSMLEALEELPLQYLIGEWDFMGRTFKVEEGILIPRPETELLVEKVLSLLEKDKDLLGFEIGVGTGCISISLLLERPRLRMYASDVQQKAIELARKNAQRYGVQDRLFLVLGDMFEPVKDMVFDFVVSNPPYIPKRMWEKLDPKVRKEGYLSLIGGEKGTEFYERFSKEVGKHLKEGGFFALEIGHDQGKVVRKLFEKEGFRVEVYKDLSGQDRLVVGWK
ncbi:peptide chain release factor N(5)-glutamine methyltransferase [Thermocrinis minervae]|nr:peptide chain release factor N(5)-glutamine methyltransferase [Thermocrinis minervae]